MKIILFLIASILPSLFSFASAKSEKGLPLEPDTTKIDIAPLAEGQELTLNFHLGLPQTQKLNQGAPSFVSVYEKVGNSDWTETAKFDLNKVFSVGSDLAFIEKVKLRSPNSKIAVHSTVFHCGKDNKSACYIQGFQGIAKRVSTAVKKSTILPFYIEGKIKKF